MGRATKIKQDFGLHGYIFPNSMSIFENTLSRAAEQQHFCVDSRFSFLSRNSFRLPTNCFGFIMYLIPIDVYCHGNQFSDKCPSYRCEGTVVPE